MQNIPLISDEFVEANTDFNELINRLKTAFARDSVLVPLRHHHDFPNPQEVSESSLLLMPAWDPVNDTASRPSS